MSSASAPGLLLRVRSDPRHASVSHSPPDQYGSLNGTLLPNSSTSLLDAAETFAAVAATISCCDIARERSSRSRCSG